MRLHVGHWRDDDKQKLFKEFAKFNSFLENVTPNRMSDECVSDVPTYPFRVVIFGNHDLIDEGEDWDMMKALLPAATHVLCNESVVIYGLKIFGMPWISRKDKTREESFSCIPSNVDILITHSPAKGIHDKVSPSKGNKRIGKKDLMKELSSAANPFVHLFGHVHEDYGCTLLPSWGAASSSSPVPDFVASTKWFSRGYSVVGMDNGCASSQANAKGKAPFPRISGADEEAAEVGMPESERGEQEGGGREIREDAPEPSPCGAKVMRCVVACNSALCDEGSTCLIHRPHVIEFRKSRSPSRLVGLVGPVGMVEHDGALGRGFQEAVDEEVLVKGCQEDGEVAYDGAGEWEARLIMC